MKYLLLIYHNPAARQVWEAFSEAQRAEDLAAYAALNEELAASGELIAAEALSMDRAVAIAARIPEAAVAQVEVRPIMTYTGLEM